jgi:hypothetical protein
VDFSNRLDMAAAAKYLGRSTHWLSVNRARLGIPSYRIGRRYFFLKEELDQWLLKQRADDFVQITPRNARKLEPVAL